MAGISDDRIGEIVGALPSCWQVPPDVREAIVCFLIRRASYLKGRPPEWFCPIETRDRP